MAEAKTRYWFEVRFNAEIPGEGRPIATSPRIAHVIQTALERDGLTLVPRVEGGTGRLVHVEVPLMQYIDVEDADDE
jgi:DNA primase